MKRRLSISLWTFGLSILTAIQASGQVSICDTGESAHPVDIRAFYLRDSLQLKGIDTIIIYRHWLTANGFNGYGKVIWYDKGQCFQYKIEFENDDGKYGLKPVNLTKLKSDSLFDFFFDNQMDTITSNPTKQSFHMSHDAQHLVEVMNNDNNYCYIISGLLVQFNPDNLRAKFVSLLSDEKESIILIEMDWIPADTKGKKRK